MKSTGASTGAKWIQVAGPASGARFSSSASVWAISFSEETFAGNEGDLMVINGDLMVV